MARTGETPCTEQRFRDLPSLLDPGDLLVVNETRVIPARLRTRLERTGREVEVLLSHPVPGGWEGMLGPSRRLVGGDRLVVERDAGTLLLTEPRGGGRWILAGAIEEIMERTGHIPIPPYFEREDRPDDRAWYQTVFAREPGAVAAPTAGLHFTPALLSALRERGVEIARVILHVGPGTFLPVRAMSAEEHYVLPERYEVPASTAEMMSGRRVIAVGTTVVRALETWARGEASGWTDLTILPGFEFKVVRGLVTNFHLPRSSLLLLVAAFAGRERILAAYRQAVASGFRFYSYGDAMLIL